MLDFWLKVVSAVAARLVHGTRKDVEQKEQVVAVEEKRTKVAKVQLTQSRARKARAARISKALL